MPEEGRGKSSAPPPVEERSQNAQTLAERFDEERRAALIRRVILIGTILSVIAIGLYVPLYLQTGTWQILADAAGLVIGLACLGLASRSVRRSKLDAAGYWLLSTLVITYGSSELVWAGETPYNAIGGTILILLVGSMVLRRRWRAWLIAAGLYLILVLLINQFRPLPRYSAVAESPAVYYFDMGLTILLILAAFWMIGRAFRIGTIRTRLLIAFVVITLVPLIGASLGAGLGSLQANRQQTLDKLELVAVLKEAEVKAWTQALHAELSTALMAEDTRGQASVLLQEESPSSLRAAARQSLRDELKLLMIRTQHFEELFLTDLDGQVVLSTDAVHEGQDHTSQAYFWKGLESTYIQAPTHYPALNRIAVVFARPVIDSQGQTMGVLAGRASLEAVQKMMRERTGLGQTGEMYLIDRNYAVLTGSRTGRVGMTVHTEGADDVVETQRNGSGLYGNIQGRPVVGVYHWLPELQVGLLAEQEQTEVFQETYTALRSIGGIAFGTLVLAVVVALLITRSIANPITRLAEAATHIAGGDMELTVKIEREDEIGTLARAFNSMTGQLHDLISNLEKRVSDRTRELEQRSAYLEASADVGRTASSILDADQLMRQVVELIRERFDLYYVGMFLVNATGTWAVLRAGTGEPGRAMLARDHRIKAGEGMVGWSIANAQGRIALDVGEDAVRLATAELPDTRSEAALPLRSRGRVIGALTIQSDKPAAFDEATIATLQIMADYVAVALDNARLFAESQVSLEAARRAHSTLGREAWTELLHAQPRLGYRCDERGITSAGDVWRPEMERALQTGQTIQGNEAEAEAKLPLAVPIKVRGDVIGVLDTYKPAEAGKWTSEEITLLEALADQLGLALESGRLYEDAQRRAIRERLTREITDKMRRASGVEGIVQTAVDELFSVLGASRTFVRLGEAPSTQEEGTADHDE
jgi:GAF domain-containing protein/HAMP domain-containing protein